MDTLSDVRTLLLRHLPRGTDPETLVEGLHLGTGGAGLDSIAMVDLLLDCEQRFAITISEQILADGSFTLGALVQAVRDRVAARHPG
ncbi:MAG: acyl carrier protein [Vicinamibacterales bacterium]